jgi:hypothetical protein
MEKFEGQFTGKVIVTIADDILGFVRNVDADGVITFEQQNVKHMRMQFTALSAQVRQAVDDKFTTAFGYRLDSAKACVEELVNVLNVILTDATIEVEAAVQKADEANADSHDAIFYKISEVKLDEMMSYLVAQHFVENFMKVTDMTRQQLFITKLFGVKL